MNIRFKHAKLSVLVLLFCILNVTLLWAGCLTCNDLSNDNTLNVSVEYKNMNLESTDNYFSGAGGTETWKAVHDVDGDMYGVSIRFEPPIWNKRVRFDFNYMTGELDGTFNTQEISPTPEGPYTGKVKFDRDELEFGVDVFILEGVYARLQYSGFEMDGDWVYDISTPNEPQEYDFDSFTAGIGFRQLFYPDKESRFGIGVLLFAGFSFFDYEHTEKTNNATIEYDGNGYELSAELLGSYDLGIGKESLLFVGVGYNYAQTDDTNLDLTQDGITARLGIRVAF